MASLPMLQAVEPMRGSIKYGVVQGYMNKRTNYLFQSKLEQLQHIAIFGQEQRYNAFNT